MVYKVYILIWCLIVSTSEEAIHKVRAQQEERVLFWSMLAVLSVAFTYIIFFLIDKKRK